MKKSLLLILLFATFTAFAQNDADTTKPWKTSGLISLTINQASFSNWSPGGENSISGTGLFKYFADYTKGDFSINNSVNLKYGILKSESESLKKSEDLIELNSQFNQKFSKYWSGSALLNFTSQFANGYNYPDDKTVISTFMAPGYLTIAPGLTYKPADYFSILISPATMKTVFVFDQDLADIGAFGVDKADTLTTGGIDKGTGKNSKVKVGAFVEFYFKKDLKTDLSLESKLNVFYNYLSDNNLPDNTAPIDLNWQTFVNYKISKLFSANLFVNLVYKPTDVIISNNEAGETVSTPNDKMQVNQTFGIGLAYNF